MAKDQFDAKFQVLFQCTGKLEHYKGKMIKIQYTLNRVFSLQFDSQEKDESPTNTFIEHRHYSLREGNTAESSLVKLIVNAAKVILSCTTYCQSLLTMQSNANITWVKSAELTSQFCLDVAYSAAQNKCHITIENKAIAIVTHWY